MNQKGYYRTRYRQWSLLLFVAGVIMLCFSLCAEATKTIHVVGGIVLIAISSVLWSLFSASVKKRFGLKFLSAMQAITFQSVAQAIVDGGKMEVLTGADLVENIDKYLASFSSSRKLEIRISLIVLEYLPIVYLHPPMSMMSARMRAAFIRKHLLGGKGTLRNIIQSSAQLSYMAYYGDERTFSITGYKKFEDRPRAQGRAPDPETPAFDSAPPTSSATIETDILVIGSGAAGALLANRFAENGRKVILLERGKHFIPKTDFTNVEPEMIGKLYVDGGLQLTQDLELSILQGTGVGGTTLINNGICFRIPDTILDDWDNLGCKIDREKLAMHYTSIEQKLNVHPLEPRIINEGANRFMAGVKILNNTPGILQTNFNNCLGSGNCNLGCKYNRKLSMLMTYIPWAVAAGARVIAESEAVSIVHSGGNVSAVKCKTKSGVEFTIRAKKVVIAAGAIGSSVLLLKNGITRNVGSRISFNVTAPMQAMFGEPIDSYDGVQMCAYLKEEDFIMETTFNPPAATALITQGWFAEHYGRLKNYRNLATISPVVGTDPVGKLKKQLIGGYGVDFKITDKDFTSLKNGVKEISRVMLAAGATEVLPATFTPNSIKSVADIDRVVDAIVNREDISMTSAHPQGGNAMSDDKSIGVVNTNFQVHGFSNLFVADASVFPTSVHVNPQLPIMALAEYAADRIMSL